MQRRRLAAGGRDGGPALRVHPVRPAAPGEKEAQYADPRRVGAASQLDADLADIHSIMRRNIDEVLNRGERLDALVETSQTLRSEAGKYKWGAKKFSLMVAWQQYAPLICLGAVVAFVVYLKVLVLVRGLSSWTMLGFGFLIRATPSRAAGPSGCVRAVQRCANLSATRGAPHGPRRCRYGALLSQAPLRPALMVGSRWCQKGSPCSCS